MAHPILITGGRVCAPDGLVTDAALVIAEGRIAHLGPAPAEFDGLHVRLDGALVTPGLIDTHVHGGLAHDAMDATPDALAGIAAHLAAHGVTGWLPTTVACPAGQLDAILRAVTLAMAEPPPGARILGAHLESNFLAPRYKGAQPLENLRPADDAELLAVIERHRAMIRVLTLAPELPGALDLVRRLRGWGITVAVGHTDATYDEVGAAVTAGATRLTHLCNAQRPFHHREPGVVGAGLVMDGLACEIIADGVHVHPAGVQIAYRCKPAAGLMLVSDALRGTGLAPGDYELGGQLTHLDGQVARLADGTIAGSTITLDRAIGFAVTRAGVPLAAAVAMASTNPAASLGLADRGRLAVGLRADLAVLDADFRCEATMVAGEWVHQAHPEVAPW